MCQRDRREDESTIHRSSRGQARGVICEADVRGVAKGILCAQGVHADSRDGQCKHIDDHVLSLVLGSQISQVPSGTKSLLEGRLNESRVKDG